MRSFLLLYPETGGDTVSLPAMLANWVGDDSSQTVSGQVFNLPWIDRINNVALTASTTTTMYNTAFNGHKAIWCRDDAGVFGLQNASPGISTVDADYTFFFAMRPSEVTTPEKTMFDLDNITDNTECSAYYWHSSAATKSGQFWAEDTWTGAYNGTGLVGDIDILTDTIFTIDCQGNDVKWYKNGTHFSTNAGYWAARKINDRFALMCTYNLNSRINNSWTAEIRIYPALTADQQMVVVNEMKTLYGIS